MKHLSCRLLLFVLCALLVPTESRGQIVAALTNAPVAAAGATLTNVLSITNTSTTNLTGVVANVSLDPHTTFVPGSVNTSPLAFDDAFAALGNVMITNNAPGLLVNDVDPDGVGPALTVVAFQILSASNGNVVVSANGAFSYNPAPGFEGTDTFTYSISDGEGFTNVGRVTVTVTGMIWFVRSTAPAGGDGRLTTPFNSVVGAGSLASAPTDPGDSIFIYSGNYAGGNLTLKNRQRLIGQGASASLESISGLLPPPLSIALPPTGGTRPNINAGAASNINLASSNLLRGLNLTAGAGTAVGGSSVGELTISEMSVTNTSGRAIHFANGTLAVSLSAVSASGGAPGIRLANTTGSFAIAGDGALSQNGTGGTIQGGANGIELDSAQNVSLARMNITGTGGSGVWGRNVNGLVIDWCSFANNGDAVDESGIRLGSVIDNGLIGSAPDGAFPTRIANTAIRAASEMNVAIFNSSGTLAQLNVTNVISKDTRTTPLGADGFYFETRGTAVATVNFDSCSFSNNFTQGLQASAAGSSALTINVRNCGFTNNYEGLALANANDADITFDVAGNRFLNNPTNSGSAIAVVNATTVTSSAIYAGKLRNNLINGGGVDNHLVAALFAGTGNNILLVASNSIVSTNAQFSGIFIQGGEAAGAPNAALTVHSNNVSVGTLATDAIFLQSRGTATLCAHITNNTASSAGPGFSGIFVRQRDTSTFRLPGYTGAANSISSVTNFIKANNPASPSVSGTLATGYSGGAPCALPAFDEPAKTEELFAEEEAADFHARVAELKIHAPIAKVKEVIPWTAPSAKAVTSIPLGTLPTGKSITVVFRSTITNPFPVGVCLVSNQATLAANGGIAVLSDDPRTPAAFDPTFTLVPAPPSIVCSINVNTTTAAGSCGRSVSFATPALGCPSPAVICRIGTTIISSPHIFAVGTNTVTCTATNLFGTNACSFTVTVRDTEAPAVTCPANIVQTLPAGQTNAVIHYPAATASDNCAVTNLTHVPPSGSTFGLGTNVVRVTATDASGNTNGCTFLVILNPPNTPPLRVAGDLAPRVFTGISQPNSLGFNTLAFSAGTNVGEGSQTLTWRARLLPAPSIGSVLQGNDAAVAAGVDYPLHALTALKFMPAANAFGFGWFEFEVMDNGNPSLSITQSVAIGVGVTNTSTNVATFCSAFNGAPTVGAAIHGHAFISPAGGENNSGTLRLTQADLGQMGSIIVEDIAGGWPVEELDVVFRVRVGGGSFPPADGFSFSWGTNIVNGAFGEEGDGNGLRVAFDTFDNTGGEAPAVDIYWRNQIVWHTPVPIEALQTGSGYADVRIRVDAMGRIYVSMGAYVFYNGLPITGFEPIAGGRYALGARTGALYDNHFVDDLCLLPRFAQTRITSFGPPTTMPWTLQFSGTPGYHYVLESSTNLVNWSFHANLLAPSNGTFQFVETNRTSPAMRFYRLRGLGAFPTGLRALWHGDGGARDSVGSLHGTTTGTVNHAAGVLGPAFDFNGIGGAVLFGGAALPPPWTVGMWVKRRAQLDPSSVLLFDGATGLKLEQWPNTGAVGYTQYGVTDYSLVYSAPLDAWVHLTFVGTASDVSLYVNGSYSAISSGGINLPLGQLGHTITDRPNASVDEISVFDRALLPIEVMQVYRASGGN